KKPKTTKNAGKLTVAVTSAGGTPTGDVTLTLKRKGQKKTKTIKATLVGGAVVVKLPKLKAGKWTVTVAYAGDTKVKAGTAEVKVKVKQAAKKKNKGKK
ncbi:MAG TPA: Ig-like domain repeat protein, partial [Nocardioides sp.]|nr:Ig-like domain repeat protein [Nocardioides sp.]